MFSGPDFLYANIFFPKASTYVLSGLERVGPIPDVAKLKGNALSAALGHLKTSLRYMLGHSYFITSQMGSHLSRGQLNGTLPDALRVPRAHRQDHPRRQLRAARARRQRQAVRRVGAEGACRARSRSSSPPAAAPSRRSTTSAPTSPTRACAKSGFLKFCEQLQTRRQLRQERVLSAARQRLLERAQLPARQQHAHPAGRHRRSRRAFFKEDEWTLQPFGRYTTPDPRVLRAAINRGSRRCSTRTGRRRSTSAWATAGASASRT